MIKKINIALLVCCGLLFGMKIMIGCAAKIRSGAQPDGSEEVQSPEEKSQLAPTIYYTRRAPVFAPNRVTNRNGVLMDVLREIFPQARFVGDVDVSSAHLARDVLEKVPSGVTAEYGDVPDLADFPSSKMPLGIGMVCLYLPRTSTWTYNGPNSLDALRIGFDSDFLACSALADFKRKWRDVPGKVVVLDISHLETEKLGKMVDEGKLDAYADVQISAYVSMKSDDAKTFVKYRRSAVIGQVPLFFRASRLDPEFSKRLIADFENGMRRIIRNGVLLRIFSYYVPEEELPETEKFFNDICARYLDDERR